MAVILSAQSGNWTDATTWVGGVVPTLTDDKTILSDHTVAITETFATEGTLKVEGIIDIQDTCRLELGTFATKKRCTLVLSGGTITGLGRLGVNWAHITSEGENWSTISCYGLSKIPTTSSSFFWSWDISKVKLEKMTTLDVLQGFLADGSVSPTFNISNCVFSENTNIQMLQRGGYVGQSDFLLEGNAFVNNTTITFGGTQVKNVTVNKCLFLGGEVKWGGTTIADMLIVKNSAFLNCYTWNIAPNYRYKNNYYSHRGATSYTTGLGYSPTGHLIDCVVYCPTEATNNRAITHCNVTGCFVEDVSTGGSNTFLADSNPVNWSNNILIGNSDGFSALVDTSGTVNHIIKNNTSTSKFFADYERYTPAHDSNIEFKNNIQVPYLENTLAYFIATLNGLAGPMYVNMDYNHRVNEGVWLDDVVFNNLAGENNVTHDDRNFPDFLDGTRNQEQYAKEVLGIEYTSYEDIWRYMYNVTGYDELTGVNSNTPFEDTTIISMNIWLKEGYTPQNMELATAGEGGTYVGAVMPKEAPSGLKVVFNGQTVARAFFNGQPIALDKIKFLQS